MNWKQTVEELLGKPFSWNGEGPHSFSCWGLCREVLRRDGKPIDSTWTVNPDDAFPGSDIIEEQMESGSWSPVLEPEPGHLVLMSRHTRIHHMGIVTPFGILHTHSGISGAILSTEQVLRRLGYRRIEYWRWAG